MKGGIFGECPSGNGQNPIDRQAPSFYTPAMKNQCHISDIDSSAGAARTVAALVADAAQCHPEAIALLAPGRLPGSYADLLDTMTSTARILRSIGIGAGDRVAMVVDNGPEMAALFLSVAACAVSAPLNPAHREAEFAFFLADLKPKALVVGEGSTSPALAVALAMDIPILTLHAFEGGPCCAFTLHHHAPVCETAPSGPAVPDDSALLLYTSGTTSRPKLVVLTHANLWHSAHHIRHSLDLSHRDRCLNVMPLFHIHGLAGAVLSSLAAGASVVCTTGLATERFFEWLQAFHPTWYTAVPTMHKTILDRSAAYGDIIAACPLRFVRSCSSALPPQLMAEIEGAFAAPVLEAYGMTEAAHQMCCNPLPPLVRKPGSVGVATGLDVTIMNEAGDLLPAGQRGEVVIRGANVTPGYADNAAANAEAFTGGWLRTGDLGFLDADGYLFLSGRTKEIINRGGEKISPREIDEVLLDHPAVAQALAFAVPDSRFGEEVAAAVVLRPGGTVSEPELQAFAAKRLSDFKVPRAILILTEIPKGPTGKPQRIGLADKLGISFESRAPFVAPRTALEEDLSRLWRDLLGKGEIGVLDTFWNLGGDSLQAAQMLARVRRDRGAEVPIFAFFAAPSVEGLAAAIASYSGPTRPPLLHQPPSGEVSLSSPQERMWIIAQMDADSSPYTRTAIFRFRGPLDLFRVGQTINGIVARHEILRTTYHLGKGALRQEIHPPYPMAVAFRTAGSLDAVRKLAAADMKRPFDLARDPVLRITLVQLAPDDHCLILIIHHIAFDGWSAGVFLSEFAAIYQESALPELTVQYSDYVRWQRSGVDTAGLAWWKEHLQGLSGPLSLPTDHPRPACQTYRGRRETLTLPRELMAAVEALSRQENATLFMTLLAAFQTLLHRYSDSSDIAVGCPMANRTPVETEPLIGLFVNTLVMRTDCSGNPAFRDLLSRVRQTAVSAYGHADIPFEKVVDVLRPERSLAYSPLFQVLFDLRNLPCGPREFADVTVEPLEFDPCVALFDLVLDIQTTVAGLRCILDCNADLFAAATALRILADYRTVIESIVRNPDTLIGDLQLQRPDPRPAVGLGVQGP